MRKTIPLWIFATLPLLLCGRHLSSVHFTVEDGLPSNEVYDVFKDRSGLLWFATDHGISCFNGYSFHNFTTSDGLPDNTVFSFVEDKDGVMWMRCFDGSICAYSDGVFRPWKHNAALKKFLNGKFIILFRFDCDGNLWFLESMAQSGPWQQNAATGEIKEYPLETSAYAFIRDLGCGQWFAGAILKGASKPSEDVFFANGMRQIQSSQTQDLGPIGYRVNFLRKGNEVFICNGSEVKGIRGEEIFFSYKAEALIIGMNFSPEGGLLLTGKAGVWLIQPDRAQKLEGDISPVTDAEWDLQGGLWLTTIGKGIYLIPNTAVTTLGEIFPELEPSWTSVETVADGVLAQNENGMLLHLEMNATTGEFVRATPMGLYPQSGRMKWFAQTNELFINTKRVSLKKNEGLRTVVDQRNYPQLKSAIGTARSIFLRGDTLLQAGNNGWSYENLRTGESFKSASEGFTPFTTAVAADLTGRIWVGTTDALFVVHGHDTRPFLPGHPLLSNRITDIQPMNNNLLAVATRGAGILFIRDTIITQVSRGQGLSSDMCDRLYFDGEFLWAATQMGLCRLQVTTSGGELNFRIKKMDSRNGLPSDQINDIAVWKDFAVVATGRDLAWFRRDSFKDDSVLTPVFITSVLSDGRKMALPPAFTSSDRNLSFEFLGLNFRQRGRLRYCYKLEGHDEDWSFTTNRTVQYHNLNPGHYSFVVTTLDEKGRRAAETARLDFYLPPLVVETWWFRISAGIVIVSALFLGFWLKQRNRREKERISRDKLKAELVSLRAQMKPHFLYNTLNSIQLFILEGEVENATDYLSRFSMLIRHVLEDSRHETIPLTRELETLQLYLSLEKLRFGDAFSFETEVDPRLKTELAEIPPLLVQVFVENAIIHGLRPLKKNAKLWIRFQMRGDRLICEVEDNGIGRAAAEARKLSVNQSLGMKNARERIEVLNAAGNWNISLLVTDLHDENGRPSGTHITINFPLHPFEL